MSLEQAINLLELSTLTNTQNLHQKIDLHSHVANLEVLISNLSLELNNSIASRQVEDVRFGQLIEFIVKLKEELKIEKEKNLQLKKVVKKLIKKWRNARLMMKLEFNRKSSLY
jgi:hypothetical protein